MIYSDERTDRLKDIERRAKGELGMLNDETPSRQGRTINLHPTRRTHKPAPRLATIIIFAAVLSLLIYIIGI